MAPPHFPPPGATGLNVLVCDGGRCRAVSGRVDTGSGATLLNTMREHVRCTRGAVLIRSACLNACHRAPAVLVVARHEGPTQQLSAGMLFGPVELADDVRRLRDLIRRADGPPARS